MKINKKMIAVILIIAAVAAIAIGCSVMDKDKKENMDDVEKHNQQVLDDLYKDSEKESDKESDKDSDDKNSDDKDEDSDASDTDENNDSETYEQWVAAASVTAISLTYPDFEIESILAASDTDFGDKEDSKGIYVIFNSSGKKYAVFSKSLKEERSDKGTVDLYGQEIGFATFDMVEPGEIDKKKMKEIKVENLNELISKSTLISLYEHY
ncbi:MAG: hypothetical protein U0K95_06530 [Eubacterium sp.]|nr:hypothetical protein [Eubacterium sp.]